ncbi:polysaccharide lyase [Candidatus Pelagibacter sp.]|nr:polysaccharide lyase [Candidatus Pelagibacter sp.]MDC0853408.1 heparin lyase I family protein [Candidatus Pelagibacter sp.]
MKKLLGIVVLGLLFCSFSFAINLSEFSKEEQIQYKQIKKLKEEGVTGKRYIDEEFWIKDKENFYHNIAAFHTGIEGLRLENKRMPILGIKVGHNWGWKPKGEKLREQAAFSVIGNGTIENGEMGMIKSKKHAWHGKEFYQITGSYENCNPQYWDWNECTHVRGSVHNESRDKKRWTTYLSKDGSEAWMHIATKPVRNILYSTYNDRRRNFHIMQCHPKGDTINFMITYRAGKLFANLQFVGDVNNGGTYWVLKDFVKDNKINKHKGADEWTSITIQMVNSSKNDKGMFNVWLDGNEKPVVEYKGFTATKNRINCFLAAGIYVNGAQSAKDWTTSQDATVWADAVAVAKSKKKLFSLIKKKDK